MARIVSMFLVLVGWAVAAAAQSPQPTIGSYHLDAIGSVRAVTDQSGALVRQHTYFPFGEEYLADPTVRAPRFGGKERDAETGLDYFGARYYASRTGRFTTVDPGHVGGNIFDPQSWNAYAYARNNPLRFVDPTGTDYRVNVFGGESFWVETDRDLRGLEQGGFSFAAATSSMRRADGSAPTITSTRSRDWHSMCPARPAQASMRRWHWG